MVGSSAGVKASPRVRLMVAVPDAGAYEQVMALVHDGRLTAMDGEAFVVVGDFADARQGHALGMALQRRLRLPFELVYDSLPPQAGLSFATPAPKALAPEPQKLPPTLPPKPTTATVVAESEVYLYADPRNEYQLSQLAQFLDVPLMHPKSEGVPIGVFRDTPPDSRLLRHQEAALQALGIPVQRYRRTQPDNALAVAVVR